MKFAAADVAAGLPKGNRASQRNRGFRMPDCTPKLLSVAHFASGLQAVCRPFTTDRYRIDTMRVRSWPIRTIETFF
jgi:hypothetical protein